MNVMLYFVPCSLGSDVCCSAEEVTTSFVGRLNVIRVLARDYLRWQKTGTLPWETDLKR